MSTLKMDEVDGLEVESAVASIFMEDSDAFLLRVVGCQATPPLEISLDISKWRSSSRTLS